MPTSRTEDSEKPSRQSPQCSASPAVRVQPTMFAAAVWIVTVKARTTGIMSGGVIPGTWIDHWREFGKQGGPVS